MHDIRAPAELLDRFEHAPGKEDRPLVVIRKKRSVFVPDHGLAVKIVLVVDEVNLHAGRRNRRDLDNQLMIVVVDDQIHSREADHFVQLVAALVDQPVTGHEGPNLVSSFLHPLRKRPAQYGHIGFRKIRRDFLTDIKNFAVTHFQGILQD